jgi:hypothetical protein
VFRQLLNNGPIRILTTMLADWRPKDIAALAPLLRQLADSALAGES